MKKTILALLFLPFFGCDFKEEEKVVKYDIVLYNEQGDTIQHWPNVVDRWNWDDVAHFETIDGKRYYIRGGIVVEREL